MREQAYFSTPHIVSSAKIIYKCPKYRMPYINDAHGMHATQVVGS